MAKKSDGRSDSGRHKVETEMLACMPSLKAFAISLSHNEVRADDMVQQTMLQAITNLDKFEPGTSMSAWLFTILRNGFYSEYRKLRREQEWSPEFEDSLFFSTGIHQGEAEATLDLHRLLLFLVCLPAERSDALVAVGYLGMPYEEAAERLECAVGTIKSRVNRARTELLAFVEGAVLKEVKLADLKTATKGVPKSHPYFPIAKAYEELYAACGEVTDGVHQKTNGNGTGNGHDALKGEKLWEQLVASGALDDENESLTSLIQGDQDEL